LLLEKQLAEFLTKEPIATAIAIGQCLQAQLNATCGNLVRYKEPDSGFHGIYKD